MMLNSYIAGLLDGEGCFGLYKTSKGSIWGDISIGVTFKPILFDTQNEYGGILYETKAGTNKIVWRWKISGIEAINMIERVAPHMHEKYRQAVLLKDFLCWRAEQPRWDHHNNIKTDWESVDWMVKEMKRLKRE